MRTRVKDCFSVLNTWARTHFSSSTGGSSWPDLWHDLGCSAELPAQGSHSLPHLSPAAQLWPCWFTEPGQHMAWGESELLESQPAPCFLFFVLSWEQSSVQLRTGYTSVQRKHSEDYAFTFFFLLCKDRQLPPAQHSQPHAGCQSCFSFSQHLSRKQTYQLLYIHASAYRSLWQE